MITYSISQCQREFQLYNQMVIDNQFSPDLREYVFQCRERWQYRLAHETGRAIAINREIICQWESPKLIDVIQQGHNPYMAVAALRLLVEDPKQISDHDIGIIILFMNPLHSRFDLWHEINILEGELDRRYEERYCPECECRRIDCECSETDAESAGWRQSDHI